MNAITTTLLLLSTFTFCVINAGVLPSEAEETTIKCHSCKSDLGGPCEDVVGNGLTETIECTGEFPTCYHYVQWGGENLTEFVQRSCVESVEGFFCPSGNGGHLYCENCWGGDLCNNKVFSPSSSVAKKSNSDGDVKRHYSSSFKVDA